jgi:hypothetical protein
MTDAAYKADPKEALYVTDAELIRRMGVPEKIAREAIRMMDGNPRSGFPKKNALWGNRRYWPAVKAYLDRSAGLNSPVPQRRTGNDE